MNKKRSRHCFFTILIILMLLFNVNLTSFAAENESASARLDDKTTSVTELMGDVDEQTTVTDSVYSDETRTVLLGNMDPDSSGNETGSSNDVIVELGEEEEIPAVTIPEDVYRHDSLINEITVEEPSVKQMKYIIRGQILDLDKNPLENIKIYLDNGEIFALSDKSGMFEFNDVSEGLHKLYYMQDETTSKELGIIDAVFPGESQCSYQIEVAYSINVEDGIMIYESGRVSDIQGDNGLVNVKLEYVNQNTGKKFITVTDADGSYAIDLPKGEYEVSLTKKGFRTTNSKVGIGKPTQHITRRR
jgi:hypothetical protein